VSALERAYRDERAAVLATITRRLDGDLALAEDAVQTRSSPRRSSGIAAAFRTVPAPG
jgi:predicted RNA polymerase sigma factor